MDAGKKKKAFAVPKGKVTSVSAIECRSGVIGNLMSFLPQTASLSFQPPPCARASVHYGPEAQDTTGEIAAQICQQLGPTEGRLAYVTVVAGVPSL